jgi:hypothetical protein
MQQYAGKFVKGDTVTVVGARARFGNETVIVAREIVEGGEKVTVRDENGRPLWEAQ